MRPTPIIRRSTAVGLVLLAIELVVGCGLGSSAQFSEGDCVLAKSGVFDDDLEPGDCSVRGLPLGDGGLPHRVGAVLDGANTSCNTALSEWDIEFSHEPDGVTYCLVGRTVDVSALHRLDRAASASNGNTDPTADDFTGDGAPPECIDAAVNDTRMPAHCADYGMTD